MKHVWKTAQNTNTCMWKKPICVKFLGMQYSSLNVFSFSALVSDGATPLLLLNSAAFSLASWSFFLTLSYWVSRSASSLFLLAFCASSFLLISSVSSGVVDTRFGVTNACGESCSCMFLASSARYFAFSCSRSNLFCASCFWISKSLWMLAFRSSSSCSAVILAACSLDVPSPVPLELRLAAAASSNACSSAILFIIAPFCSSSNALVAAASFNRWSSSMAALVAASLPF